MIFTPAKLQFKVGGVGFSGKDVIPPLKVFDIDITKPPQELSPTFNL